MVKPEKILYENQEVVFRKAVSQVIPLLRPACVNQAIVWASLAEHTFGVYKEQYEGKAGSDIDLVIIVDERYPIPKEWKFTKVKKSWFDLYQLGYFVHENHIHPIDGLLVFPSRHDLSKVMTNLKGRSKVIYVKEDPATNIPIV